MNLTIDPKRTLDADSHGTGYYVRAKRGERFGSYDIAELDRPSLARWLAGLDREGLESIVFHLLGHRDENV